MIKLSGLRILIVACVVAATVRAHAAADASSSTAFVIGSAWPNTSVYVEALSNSFNPGSWKGELKYRIWLRSRKVYRIEERERSDQSPSWCTSIQVRDAHHVYYTNTVRSPMLGCEVWRAWPEAWARDDLELFLQLDWVAREARRVGSDVICGLPVVHWRGHFVAGSGPSVTDIWLCTDPRYPFPLRVERMSGTSPYAWRVTSLKLGCPMPRSVFTPRIHPEQNLSILLCTHKPPAVAVVWWMLYRLAELGFVLAFAWPPGALRRSRRLLGLVASATLVSILMAYAPVSQFYTYSAAGIPMVLALAIVEIGFAVALIRTLGWPKKLGIFRGTTWDSVLLILLVAVPFLFHQWRHLHSAVGPRLPQAMSLLIGVPLLSMLVRTAVNAGVQELVFRGYIYQALDDRLKHVAPVILTQAVIFAAFHMPGHLMSGGALGAEMHYFLHMAGAGALYGILRWRSRNIGVPWLWHFVYNFVLFASEFLILAGGA